MESGETKSLNYSSHRSSSEMNSSTSLDLARKDSFMAEAETYLTFTIAQYLSKYWFPFLVPIGLFGNTLSFLVVIKPSNRKVSTCIYMAAISINDNIMMCLAFHHWMLSAVRMQNWNPLECHIKAFLTAVTLINATFQVLAMTVDKYIAVKWPHKAAVYNTPRRALITSIVIYICVVSYNIPNIFISTLIGNECIGYAKGGAITKVYSLFAFSTNGVLALILLSYFNCVIVQTVRQSRTLFQNNGTSIDGKSPTINNTNQRRQKSMESVENQLTVMLLLVTTLFLILMIPVQLRVLYLLFVTVDTPFQYAYVKLLFQVTHKLYNTNSGLNFFLYCLSGRKFRNDLKELLCCSGRKKKSFVGEKHELDSNITIFSTTKT